MSWDVCVLDKGTSDTAGVFNKQLSTSNVRVLCVAGLQVPRGGRRETSNGESSAPAQRVRLSATLIAPRNRPACDRTHAQTNVQHSTFNSLNSSTQSLACRLANLARVTRRTALSTPQNTLATRGRLYSQHGAGGAVDSGSGFVSLPFSSRRVGWVACCRGAGGSKRGRKQGSE